MQVPLTITAHGMDLPASVESLIRERFDNLERYHPRIVSCRVTVEGPGEHHRTGGPYSLKVIVRVPARELVVTLQGAEDPLVAIREAFDAMRRQVQDAVRVRRGKIKRHEGGR